MNNQPKKITIEITQEQATALYMAIEAFSEKVSIQNWLLSSNSELNGTELGSRLWALEQFKETLLKANYEFGRGAK